MLELAGLEAERRSPPRGRDRRLLRLLALSGAALAVAVPDAALAEFNCGRSVAYNSTRCEDTVVFSVTPTDAKAVCAEFSRRLGAQCKPTWDKFRTCDEFASRFEDLLLKACLARNVAEQSCASWAQAFSFTPRTRCEQGRFSY
jgi:hypothetical protein